ncbi:SCO family protein [Caryophanon tenue]|uniref:Cytochrome c oxidase assembly protein n=1 Tax=Caryophanon tenue TaxID=33978 RepID=A0A1C0Y742_9BACL|nr:SCO family protein [Caryophanon tenue]OCS82971.1 cytochrome c oxidase assembly protein [Caryophanon tenue]
MQKQVIAVFLCVLLLSGCSSYQFKADTNWEVESFTMTNHRGETVTNETFAGKPYLAMFMFTSCVTVCSPMTFNMTQIQQELATLGVEDYHIVGFSVDPDVDTPQKLTEYLSFYEPADESKWQLLTGYDQTFITQFARNSFKTLVQDDPTSDQVIHGITFYLVNEDGIAVKNYTGYAEDDNAVPIEQMAKDLQQLIEQ